MEPLNRSRLIRFVLSRKQKTGGFSFSRTTPPTLEDSYYALRTFEEIGVSYNNKKTARYIENLGLGGIFSIRNTYRFLYLCDRLGLFDCLAMWKEKLKSQTYRKDSLEDIYYLMLSREILKEKTIFDDKLRNRVASSKIKIEKLRYIPELSRQIILMKKTKIPFNEVMYAEWIQKAQMPDGGYGFLQHSTSFMETTYHALKALEILNATPLEIEKCKEFILMCRGNEGFGRRMISLPTLEATYYAISNLDIIRQMRKLRR